MVFNFHLVAFVQVMIPRWFFHQRQPQGSFNTNQIFARKLIFKHDGHEFSGCFCSSFNPISRQFPDVEGESRQFHQSYTTPNPRQNGGFNLDFKSPQNCTRVKQYVGCWLHFGKHLCSKFSFLTSFLLYNISMVVTHRWQSWLYYTRNLRCLQ